MKTYSETLEWLFAQLPMFQRVGAVAYKSDLSNTHALCAYLQHPERGLRCLHIAGTNGKGSTSHMLASILQEAGYNVGLYTSPHLVDFRERIRINRQPISEEWVCAWVDRHQQALESMGLSFFEMTVGMAFHAFRGQSGLPDAPGPIDVAVVEVGMGGRLDSTNVVVPDVSVITNIGFDHMQFLGDTLVKIAGEKAGIIKPGIPVVVGERHPETVPVFLARAAEARSEVFWAESEFPEGFPLPECGLKGPYQAKNIRTVLSVLKRLESLPFYRRIDLGSIERGLLNVVENTGLLGRWQVLGERPRMIADTAHNEHGLRPVLAQLEREPQRALRIVWGMVADKDSSGILSLLPGTAVYYFCRPNLPRGKNADELQAEAAQYGLSGQAFPSVRSALAQAQSDAHPDDLIYIGGSTFVVAEVL
ncbi:bifunctional folylpolyglutamate synthase/dihydrofolate synthase [bacterium]|nr:bifunctional folylpolyglutamate synthase/dihydrofolate synthase [bacterium]